jgi:hypothetical protein
MITEKPRLPTWYITDRHQDIFVAGLSRDDVGGGFEYCVEIEHCVKFIGHKAQDSGLKVLYRLLFDL